MQPRSSPARLPLLLSWKPVCLFLAVLAILLPGATLPPARAADAGPAALVKDINTASTAAPGFTVEGIITIGDVAYFAAADPEHGAELWRSDGTAAGTALVKDIAPGAGSSSPRELTDVGGTLFFVTIDDDAHEFALWKSDGTAAGTVPLKTTEQIPGGSAESLFELTSAGGRLFFVSADPPDYHHILWASDGTLAGTIPLKDLPGRIADMADVGGTLFLGIAVADGAELWRSDGTAAGTMLVTHMPGVIGQLANMNGSLLFALSDSGGAQLWKSDGTPAGTAQVKALPGIAEEFTSVNGTLFFSVSAPGAFGLWKSDGTPAGTAQVKAMPFALYELTAVGGTLFFAAYRAFNRMDLWKSDGTPAGTALVEDIAPGAAELGIFALTRVGGAAFFVAQRAGGSYELWTSDGTPAGTALVKGMLANIFYLTDLHGLALFFAGDPTAGFGLWRSDGTPAGTALVKVSSSVPAGSSPEQLTAAGGTLFFTADDDAHGRELWNSDGTAAGTVLVKDIAPGAATPFIDELTDVNGTLFFVAEDSAHGRELWKSDGTPAGTVLVKDIVPGAGGSMPHELTNVSGALFFGVVSDGKPALWKSDGTPAGTVLVKQFTASGSGARYPAPDQLTDVNGTLFFTTFEGSSGGSLWKSDGTANGTVMVKDVNASANPCCHHSMLGVNDTLFFDALYANKDSLWKSDGMPAGTILLKDNLFAENMVDADGTLFFLDYGGTQLWKSDGTQAGTKLVKDFGADVGGIAMSLSAIGKQAFVQLWEDHDFRLWSSDGTLAGTVPLKQTAYFTAGGAAPTAPVQVRSGELALFAGFDDDSTMELWVTNGSARGTLLLQNIAPGGSSPAGFVVAGTKIFFTADDGAHGRELWALDSAALDAPIASDRVWTIRTGAALSGTLDAVDLQGDDLTYTIVGAAAKGAVTITNPTTGAFSYAPNPGASGDDSFTFKVGDGARDSRLATATVRMAPVLRYLPIARR